MTSDWIDAACQVAGWAIVGGVVWPEKAFEISTNCGTIVRRFVRRISTGGSKA